MRSSVKDKKLEGFEQVSMSEYAYMDIGSDRQKTQIIKLLKIKNRNIGSDRQKVALHH